MGGRAQEGGVDLEEGEKVRVFGRRAHKKGRRRRGFST